MCICVRACMLFFTSPKMCIGVSMCTKLKPYAVVRMHAYRVKANEREKTDLNRKLAGFEAIATRYFYQEHTHIHICVHCARHHHHNIITNTCVRLCEANSPIAWKKTATGMSVPAQAVLSSKSEREGGKSDT